MVCTDCKRERPCCVMRGQLVCIEECRPKRLAERAPLPNVTPKKKRIGWEWVHPKWGSFRFPGSRASVRDNILYEMGKADNKTRKALPKGGEWKEWLDS